MTAQASIAQLGERQTEDLKVPRSIRGRGTFNFFENNFPISGNLYNIGYILKKWFRAPNNKSFFRATRKKLQNYSKMSASVEGFSLDFWNGTILDQSLTRHIWKSCEKVCHPAVKGLNIVFLGIKIKFFDHFQKKKVVVIQITFQT